MWTAQQHSTHTNTHAKTVRRACMHIHKQAHAHTLTVDRADKLTHIHTHTYTHTYTQTCKHTHTYTRTYTRTHTHAHTHTHSLSISLLWHHMFLSLVNTFINPCVLLALDFVTLLLDDLPIHTHTNNHVFHVLPAYAFHGSCCYC